MSLAEGFVVVLFEGFVAGLVFVDFAFIGGIASFRTFLQHFSS